MVSDQFALTGNLSAGPLIGIGADKYTIKDTTPGFGTDRSTVSTTYGALGASVRAVPFDNLKVSLNAYYKKSLIKPQISTNYGSFEDSPKAAGYTIEIPVEYKITNSVSAYAKYTRDTMKSSASSEIISISKTHQLLNAGISYSW